MLKQIVTIILLFVFFVANAEEDNRPVFEGKLLYSTCEYHSKNVIKYSNGQAYNGQREMSYVVKGKKIHITDLTMHIHYLYDGDQLKVYVYSDLTNKGMELDPGYFHMIFGMYGKYSMQYYVDVLVGDELEYKGDKCHEAILDIKSKYQIKPTVDIRAYYSDLYAAPMGLSYAFWGTWFPGIVKKYCMAFGTPETMLGGFASLVSSELVAMEPYNVNDAEFELPEGIECAPHKPKTYQKILSETAKILKKENPELFTQNFDTWTTIKDEWDFVSDWEQRAAHNAAMQNQYANFGSELLSKSFALTSQIMQDHASCATEASYAGDSSTNSRNHSHTAQAKKSGGKKDCTLCHGTGICIYCNGDGYNYSVGKPY